MPTSSNHIKAVVVDDHAMMRDGLVRILNSDNNISVVGQAANGKLLLELLENAEELPDVILLDISMPVMNGYETMKAIRRKWKNLKVLTISMYKNDFSIIKMIINGADGYLYKGRGGDELISAVKQIHTVGKYYDDIAIQDIERDTQRLRKLIPTLSKREIEILALCAKEMTYKDMAIELAVSPRTIESHRERLFDKLQVKTRVGLALFAIVSGIAEDKDICQ